MKKVITGWIGKGNEQPMISESMDGFPSVKEIRLDKVYENKGVKSEWEQDDWPPRKIKITIEEVGA